MQKFARLCLTLTLVTIAFVGESSACWWRPHGGRRHRCCQHCPQPACNVPVVYLQPAPVASYVTATAQSPPREAMADVHAASQAPVKTFLFKGRTFQAIPTDERGESEERELRALSTFHARAQTNDGEHFAGVARKAAKTSSAIAPVESFASPGAVLDSILMGADPSTNDQDMRRKLNANSPRARRRSATSP